MAKARIGQSGFQTPAEEAEFKINRSVALAQPHRRSLDDPNDLRAGSPLWEACRRLRLNDSLYDAGEKYGEISRDYKVTIMAPRHSYGGSGGDVIDEAKEEANAKLAKDRYWKAINILRQAHPMAQGVIERVCYDLRPLGDHEHVQFERGLYALAVELKTLDLGINEGKQVRG